MTELLTKHQLENFELNHAKAGNGYIMCEDIDSEYCRLTEHRAGERFGARAFLAAKSQLSVMRVVKDKVSVDIKIHPDLVEPVKKLRADFKSGKLAAFSTHIMPTDKAQQLREALMQ